ncbi:MAG TPA: apolipoprotein N-acyltransferase [Phycisphaerales bacterium]|nr:apolipoprotein N-acyltransferase [Phycisphaerales bacterium]
MGLARKLWAARPRLRAAGPGFASGLVYSVLSLLTLPPVSAWWLSPVVVAPLAWCATRPGRARDAALGVWFGAVPLWVVQQWWVQNVSRFGFFPLVAIQALWPAVFVGLFAALHRSTLRAPVTLAGAAVWTAVEVLRADYFLAGYAWGLLAHPTIDWEPIAMAASLGGVFAVSFLLAGLGCSVALAAHEPKKGVAHTAAWVAAMLLAIGASAWAAPGQRGAPLGPIAIAAVQTNLPQDNKIAWRPEDQRRDFSRFIALTREAAAAGPDVIVWPETMMPGISLEPSAMRALDERQISYFLDERTPDGERVSLPATAFGHALLEEQRTHAIPMLVGDEAIEGLRVVEEGGGVGIDFDRRYNSVYRIEGGAVQPPRYDKIELTPFGETMPLVSRWEWLERRLLAFAAGGMVFDLSAGHRRTVFDIPTKAGATVRVVTPICFEVTEPSLCRRLVFDGVARRAGVLINPTNDGWFGRWEMGRVQHMQISRWRCVELGTPMVRAANTGISCSIDARGRVLGVARDAGGGTSRTDGVLSATVEPGAGATVYARGGFVLGHAVFAAACVLLAVAWVRRPNATPRTGGVARP